MPAHVAIAGDGQQRNELESLAQDLSVRSRVTFLGHLSRTDISGLLAAADFFLQPSLFEGHSNALLEALASGLPILASDIPEEREILALEEEGMSPGILLPVDDPDQWASAARRLCENPKESARMAAAAMAIGRRFDFDRMVASYQALISN
jgi:glycosyltransferase involved in cell wall biosynthesis